jgi:hypothetical protein
MPPEFPPSPAQTISQAHGLLCRTPPQSEKNAADGRGVGRCLGPMSGSLFEDLICVSRFTAYDHAPQAAFPWAPEAYPGLLRGMAELLGGRAAVRTILDWRRGPPPTSTSGRSRSYWKHSRMTVSIEELEKGKAARLTPP